MKNFILVIFLVFFVCFTHGCTKGVIAKQTSKDWYEDVGIKNKNDIVLKENATKVLIALKSRNYYDRIYAAKDLGLYGKASSHFVPALIDNCLFSNGPVAIASAESIKNISGSDSDDYVAAIKILMSSPIIQSVIYGIDLAESDQKLIIKCKSSLELLSLHKNSSVSVRANGALIKGTISKSRSQSPDYEIHKSRIVSDRNKNPYSIAVVIGNNDYTSKNKSVPNVDYAINDAVKIKEFLVSSLGYEEANVIYLENATQSEMTTAFGSEKSHKGKLFNWSRAGESDIFVFYSGHGAPGLSDGIGYLLPVDADPSTVELNGYSISTLYANLSKIPAKNITVVIDACFSGSSQAGALVKSASSISLRQVEIPQSANNMVVISATGIGEVASWDERAQHGLLTSYFLKAINGEADKGRSGNQNQMVELEEVKKYLGLEVPYMARRLYGRDQNPQISGNLGFVISTLKE